MLYPFGPWTPDQPAQAGGVTEALNCVHSASGYRPFPDLAAYATNALDARCQGAAGYLASDGNIYIFAGDASKLYVLKTGATTFSDVSKVGGYTTGADEEWRFTVYGDRVIATNGSDAIQSYVMGTSTIFADLGGSPPTGRYVATAKNFVFIANTADGVDYIQWCAQGDPTDWPTPGTADAISKLSDRRQLAGNGGWIRGLTTGLFGADIAVLQEQQLVRGTFIGGDQIWQFDVVEGARGIRMAGSLVQYGGIAYYLGEEGFYSYNGMAASPIGRGKVDNFILNDATYALAEAYKFRTSSIADPDRKAILWAYPTVNSGAGESDAVIAYSWESGEWSLIPGLADIEVLTRTFTAGYTLEDLDAFGTMETLPYSLDSRFWTGGAQTMGAFNTSQTLQAFSGDNLAATLTTAERTPGGGRRAQVNGARPLVEATSATLTITPITRERPDVAATTGTAVTMNARGICKLRSTARYQRLSMGIAAAGSWSNAIGVDVPDEMIVLRGDR